MQLPSNPAGVSVGNLPLDFTKKDFSRLADNAKLVPLEGNKPDEWAAMQDRVEQTGQVADADMSRLKEFSSTVSTGKTSLKSSLIQVLMNKEATPAEKNEAKRKLEDVNCFTTDYYTLTDALKSATAKAAVAAVAGASFGPTGILAAYQTFANLEEGELKEVVADIQGLRDGKAPFIYEGNKVKQLHEEKLWQGINQMMTAPAPKNNQTYVQLYEFTSPQLLGEVGAIAQSGEKVFVNIDPTRITPPPRDKVIFYDDGSDKLRGALQLLNSGAAVSTYPVGKLLDGDPSNLMHRKLYGRGDEVILSGMNGNDGSGENIDRGYSLEGPAARRKAEDFIRDVNNSLANPSMEDRYGAKQLEGFLANTVNMGTRGLSALIDAMGTGGPAPAGTPLEKPRGYAEFSAYAEKRGLKLEDLVDGDVQAKMAGLASGELRNIELSTKGKQMCLDLMKQVNDRVNDPANVEKFKEFKLPSGEKAGNTQVTLADVPAERQATALETIQNAQKYIMAPTFVITKPIAAALAAKNDEMKAAGNTDFEIRMVADSGVYPDGSTPNKTGILMLEDHGIRPRWTLLPRSGSHDRKIHAKDILTDQSEWFGSTNLSGKGMKDNWEHSGVVKFDEKDPASIALRTEAENLFNELWTNMSFECNTKEVATYWATHGKYAYKGRDIDAEIERQRGKLADKVIGNLEVFEKESGKFVEDKMAASPKIQARVKELEKTGMDDGNAILVAVAEDMGKESFYKAMHSLPAMETLNKMIPYVMQNKR